MMVRRLRASHAEKDSHTTVTHQDQRTQLEEQRRQRMPRRPGLHVHTVDGLQF
jgi:hypothetical protein